MVSQTCCLLLEISTSSCLADCQVPVLFVVRNSDAGSCICKRDQYCQLKLCDMKNHNNPTVLVELRRAAKQ